MSELLSAALEYADRGLKVFPIWPDTKQPLTANGHLNATTNDDQITQWWTAYPAANVGLSLADSGLVALDIDAYKTECAWEHYRGANIVDAGFVKKAPAVVFFISLELIPRIPSWKPLPWCRH